MSSNRYIKYKIIGNSSVEIFNTILRQDEKIHELLDETVFSFDDFSKFDIGYELYYGCREKPYVYHFLSKVPYKVKNYGGHLSVTGSFLPNETYPVDHITIFENEEE